MAGAQEALYFGKPLICIPFFGDQPDVAQRVVGLGAGGECGINTARREPTDCLF